MCGMDTHSRPLLNSIIVCSKSVTLAELTTVRPCDETEKETEHVCPRIASRLCRTTRRTCGITKQNEKSCITKKISQQTLTTSLTQS